MPAVPVNNTEIQIEEVKPDFSVNAGTMSRMAGGVNFAIKKQLIKLQEYTAAGTYSWTPPFVGVYMVECCGGGGGGGGSVNSSTVGHGGQGVLKQTHFVNVTSLTPISITVGAGGTGGDTSGGAGSIGGRGGHTTFGGVDLSRGGYGGHFGGNDSKANWPTSGYTLGAKYNATTNWQQSSGDSEAYSGGANVAGSSPHFGGGGGASSYGDGADANQSPAATSYGAGGGGGVSVSGGIVGQAGMHGYLAIYAVYAL